MTLPTIRRIVTGHDTQGRSVITQVSPPPQEFTVPVANVGFHEQWSTHETPVPVGNGEEPVRGETILSPLKKGTRLRIIDIPPDTPKLLSCTADTIKGTLATIGDGAVSTASRRPAIHRTESIDYGVVRDGEITLLVDDGEIDLRVGDVVIQRGTNHA